MPYQLNEVQQEEIFFRIKESFKDLAFFDQLIADKLKLLIRDTNRIEIDTKTTRKLTERYYDVSGFTTEKDKAILSQIHVVLRTAYVLILSYSPENRALFYNSIDELKTNYPQFRDQDEEELKFLLHFRNYMKLALKIIPARLSKQLLLRIVARLEGSGKEYITGGGQKQCVTRRVEIYEKEGDVHAEKRTERIRHPRDVAAVVPPNGQKKRTQPLAVVRETKLMRLPSDDVFRLTKGPNEAAPSLVAHPSFGSTSSLAASSSSSAYLPLPPAPLGSKLTAAVPPLGGPPPLLNPAMIVPPSLQLNTLNDDLGEQVDLGEWLGDIPFTPLPTSFDSMPPPPLPPSYNNSTNYGQAGNFMYYNSMPPQQYGGNNALGVQLSDSFPPSVLLSRTTSEALNFLLPGGEVWNSLMPEDDNNNNNNLSGGEVNSGGTTSSNWAELPVTSVSSNVSTENTNTNGTESSLPSLPPTSSGLDPLSLMRNISWDVYSGSFSEDLRNILGSF